MTAKVARPRTDDQALALAQRYAAIDAAVAMHEADRQERIAVVSAAVDMIVAPLVDEAEAIKAVLEAWWPKDSAALLTGKRKSIEFGGCKIGTRVAAEKVMFAAGDDKAALAAVLADPVKSKVTVVKRVLDKARIAALLKGTTAAGATLKVLGFALAGGEDMFFISRVDSAAAKVSAR